MSFNTVRQPSPIRPRPTSLGQPGGTKNTIEIPPTTAIIKRASVFTLRETHLRSSQSRNIGPNNSLRRSQPCIRGDDLAKQAAASITKGVVGNSGKTTPIQPSSRNNRPNAIQRYKFNTSFSAVWKCKWAWSTGSCGLYAVYCLAVALIISVSMVVVPVLQTSLNLCMYILDQHIVCHSNYFYP